MSVDDVSLGNLLGSVKREDAPILIANSKQLDVMLNQKTMVDIGILVHAHRDHRKVRHLPLQRKQARKLFDARSTKSRPQIQHHDVSAQFAQIYRPRTIAYDELRRSLIDVSGMTSPIASCYCEQSQRQT